MPIQTPIKQEYIKGMQNVVGSTVAVVVNAIHVVATNLYLWVQIIIVIPIDNS